MTCGAKTNKTRARATTQTARLTARWEMKASVRWRLLLQSSISRNGNAEAACREGVLRAKASYDEDEGEDNGERGEWEMEDPCHLCPVHAERRRGCVEELREEARTEHGENSAGGLQIRTRIENNPSSDPRPHIQHTPPEPESPLVKDLECQRTMRMYNLWATAPCTAAPKLTVLLQARPTRSAKTSHPKNPLLPCATKPGLRLWRKFHFAEMQRVSKAIIRGCATSEREMAGIQTHVGECTNGNSVHQLAGVGGRCSEKESGKDPRTETDRDEGSEK
ncbi:hypothetical protein C8R45DRAFT_933152 [Mycena sanguinolenta]|nr:hypothetical protein C8R45DRAFT_933152 [Mycena sanguinolenta]